jgi:hypothetical protein
MAFKADVLASPRRAELRIIVGCVVAGWVLGLQERILLEDWDLS